MSEILNEGVTEREKLKKKLIFLRRIYFRTGKTPVIDKYGLDHTLYHFDKAHPDKAPKSS